jgi:lipid II:glycine glycyltransferase (peptidoglycan interpeptide bridge formation enzyme)
LPPHDYFLQNISIENTNWLPFYWKGYKQTTRYTYRLKNISNIDGVWNGISPNIKYDINKAIRNGLHINLDGNISDFIDLYKKTFFRQNLNPRYSEEKIKKLDRACELHNSRKIIIISDGLGRNHAGIYLVWNEYCAYYLMGGGDAELRNSGATSLALWESIKFASTKTNVFDFEGSMVQSIEKYFRAFGGDLTPFFQISKANSSIIMMGITLKNMMTK